MAPGTDPAEVGASAQWLQEAAVRRMLPMVRVSRFHQVITEQHVYMIKDVGNDWRGSRHVRNVYAAAHVQQLVADIAAGRVVLRPEQRVDSPAGQAELRRARQVARVLKVVGVLLILVVLSLLVSIVGLS